MCITYTILFLIQNAIFREADNSMLIINFCEVAYFQPSTYLLLHNTYYAKFQYGFIVHE